MQRAIFIVLVVFSLLCNKAKAVATNFTQKELLEASDKLSGLGKSLCKFLAQEMPENYDAQGIASIKWLQFGNSFQGSNTPIKASEITHSLEMLKNTQSGSALLASLENAGIEQSYKPLTLHLGSISRLLNTNAPLAFNTIVQTKPSSKALPFVVLNSDNYKKLKSSDSQLAIVLANELYDVLGRIVAGESITATSAYQALGIVLSDITLNKELGKKDVRTDKAQMISVYQKALQNYKNDVPAINYSALNTKQQKTLNDLTKLATAGNFTTFKALDSATVAIAVAN